MKRCFGQVILVFALFGLLAATPAFADDITDQIKAGMELYEQGKVTEAINELEFALAQMRQKKADALGDVFPDAPDGWKAEKPQSEAASRAMLGGGISATRAYTQKNGKGRAEIQIMTDSPMIQSLSMLFNNPMFLQGSGKGKLIKVQGQKALLKSRSDKRAELQAMIDNKVLLEVKVNRYEGAADFAKQLAESIDLDKIRKLNK
ncbi:hypothetical protein [Dethiosulfatarculus sandiegensis]|uniref:Uncharacterized protein n=1 Tax=Dethiosulfatarculus sandiegensis TaxID=1429043 RepID=A0A0D2GJ95_9BACT|nr:hypothetical protein [Dethiosulfatarculus sandiegensis]KIX14867.1 hypothetical protein X474_06895 [Dethiosulfatarculus sandiegensis]